MEAVGLGDRLRQYRELNVENVDQSVRRARRNVEALKWEAGQISLKRENDQLDIRHVDESIAINVTPLAGVYGSQWRTE